MSLVGQEKLVEAEQLYERVQKILENSREEPDHPTMVTFLTKWAKLYAKQVRAVTTLKNNSRALAAWMLELTSTRAFPVLLLLLLLLLLLSSH